MAGAAADGPADHVVADALAGLAGLILLGLAAAWALRLLGTDRCEFDVAESRSSLPELSEAQPDLGAASRARNQWPRFAVVCAN